MVAIATAETVLNAAHVPYVTADEAYLLLMTSLDRFLSVVETLEPEDWEKPTACTEWDVRDVLAHQAGSYAGAVGYGAMLRNTPMPKKGQLPEDALNALQLQQRVGMSPADLIEELRRVGPLGAKKWAYGFRLIKPISIPHAVGGRLAMRHLMWVIHSRDTWMHRLDICRATDRPFEQTPDHDGRIVALVMRDVAACLDGKLGGRALIFDLSGVSGGVWKVGTGEAEATIQMDALEFNILASGRYSDQEGRAKAILTGDVALAESALQQTLVLY